LPFPNRAHPLPRHRQPTVNELIEKIALNAVQHAVRHAKTTGRKPANGHVNSVRRRVKRSVVKQGSKTATVKHANNNARSDEQRPRIASDKLNGANAVRSAL
jgi:hypothetical protein